MFSLSFTSSGMCPSTDSPAMLTVEIWMSFLCLASQMEMRFSTPWTFILSSRSSFTKCFTQAAQFMTVSNSYSRSLPPRFLSVISPSTTTIRLPNSASKVSSK